MSIDVEEVAARFGQTVELTQLFIEKHGVTDLPKYRHPGDGLDAFYSDMTGFYSHEPSLTKQEFTDMCDPNVLLDRAQRGQDISFAFSQSVPRYGDFTQVPTSYHEAITVVTQANQAFMQLDPKIRAEFGNDPSRFVDFVSDPKNADKLVEMGLATPPAKTPEVTPVEPLKAPAEGQPKGGEGA